MRAIIADQTVDSAAYGRRRTLQALGQQQLPFPDRVSEALRTRTFEASRSTVRRMTGDVMGTLEQASRDGLGVGDAANRLGTQFEDMKSHELQRIARTEVNRAQQDAAMTTEIELGVTYHQWITAGDERVRSSHSAIHNQVARVGAPFGNGLLRPGDPAGPLSEVVNCRCRVVPWIMPSGFQEPVTKRVQKAFFPDQIVPIEEPSRTKPPKPPQGTPEEMRRLRIGLAAGTLAAGFITSIDPDNLPPPPSIAEEVRELEVARQVRESRQAFADVGLTFPEDLRYDFGEQVEGGPRGTFGHGAGEHGGIVRVFSGEKSTLLHELGHAWVSQFMTESAKQAMAEKLGYSSWSEGQKAERWSDKPGERVAEVIRWKLEGGDHNAVYEEYFRIITGGAA